MSAGEDRHILECEALDGDPSRHLQGECVSKRSRLQPPPVLSSGFAQRHYSDNHQQADVLVDRFEVTPEHCRQF